MNSMKYISEDSFVIRTPLKRSENYKSIYKLKKNRSLLADTLKDPYLREAIAVASIDLNESLEQYDISEKLSLKALESLEKYINRITTRTTPFGLFSTVSSGFFGEESHIALSSDLRSYKKCCTIDMEWFCSLLKLLEQDKDILFNVKIIFNRQCYISGSRIKNPYISNYGQTDSTKLKCTSIKKTKQVLLVKELTANYMPFKKLYNELLERNPEVPEEVIFKFLLQLIKNEILITDLRVRTFSHDPLRALLDKMKDFDLNESNRSLYIKLVNIDRLRKEYMNYSIGNGLKCYIDLCNKMSEIKKAQNYLNISTSAFMKNSTLGKTLKKELEDLSDFLVSISTEDNETPPIKMFKQAFADKYGMNTEVSLLELMDWDTGIGDPYSKQFAYGISKDFSEIKSSKYKIVEKLVHDKIQLCLKNGYKEVILTQKDVQDIENYENRFNLSQSFSLNIIVLAKNSECIDKGEFELLIGPNVGSDQACNGINRFYNILDDTIKQKLSEIYENEINKTEDRYVIVDTYELNHSARLMNICNGNGNYRYSINMDYGVDDKYECIDLDDIFIGFNPIINRLYIKSRKLNKLIKVINDNMLNAMGSNNIIHLLRDISYSYECHPIESLLRFQIYANNYKYFPQIRYGNTILFPETWKLEKNDFEDLKNFEKFSEEIKVFFKLWGIPRFVYEVKYDQCILMDTENETFIQYIFKEIRNRKESIVLRKANEINNIWMTNDKGDKYFSELTIPFRLCQAEEQKDKFEVYSTIHDKIITKSDYEKLKGKISLVDERRLIVPWQDNWIYFKIYCQPDNADSIISNYIKDFINSHEQSLKRYFFIRYSDPKFHIRMRFQTHERKDVGKLIEDFACWFEKLRTSGLSYRYCTDIYEKELERYGGIESMDSAETLFYYDSSYVITLIDSKWRKDKGDDEVGIVSILQILKEFLKDNYIIERLLSSIISKNEFKSEFRENKEKLLALINYDTSDIDMHVQDAFHKRVIEISKYRKLLDELDDKNLLSNSKEDIALTIVHMFCNRFKGDREWERKVSAFSRHIIYTQNNYDKFHK